MEWSQEQDRTLLDAAAWMKEPFSPERQIYYIAGFAGVGKTTIAKQLALDAEAAVLFAAYTGKAAYVMRSKGCEGATTIHSLIYKPAGESKSDELRSAEMKLSSLQLAEDPNVEAVKKAQEERDKIAMGEKRKPMFTLNHESELLDAHALILDECSMVDEYLGQDLCSFNKKILVMGDPMQLPPVGGGGYFTSREPNQLLTEVHRHARESGILRLATDIRTSGGFSRSPGHYGHDCEVLPRGDIPDFQQRVLDADQLLVGKNVTRHVCNARYRVLTKREGHLPVSGDKVVCLRNNHKIGLLNGSLWRVHEAVSDDSIQTVDMTISSEEDGAKGISVTTWNHHFMGQEEKLRLMKWERRDANEFDYGYALTVHKSQGSQWNDVVLVDESASFRNDRNRWLYTGVTRAAKTLTVAL